MKEVNINDLDSSHSEIVVPLNSPIRKHLKQILAIERPGWQYDYLVKIGKKSKYDFHFHETERGFVVASGILEIPPVREILGLPDLEEIPVTGELTKFVESLPLPYEPYDYQLKAFISAVTKKRKLPLMCTGSGKSLTISLCLEYFRQKGMKGVLVVPNINLLTQFANDIKSYNLMDLYSSIITFGGGSKKLKQMKGSGEKLNPGDLVITTWQSLSKLNGEFFRSLDYVICDEVHRFSSECTSQLVLSSKFATYKLGFTGTLPDSKSDKLTIIGLFGVPETFVTPQELIAAGRGTPIKVTGVTIKHSAEDGYEISKKMEFLDKLKFCIQIPKRTNLIVNLAKKMREKSEGSSLILYTLVDHGQQLYFEICESLGYPTSEIPPLEWQKRRGVYFMSGACTAKDREEIRLAMDEDPEAILVANYALLSTGVNIKSLRYAIFASPVKSGVTVAQSLGRGIRLADGKEVFEVYDIVDDFKGTRIFKNQFNARKKIYEKCGYRFDERTF